MASPARERRQAVLRAIVADYIAMQEPVGSKTLVEKHKLQVSSATIRNDMAVLETEGYIAQPHASSGRVPTEKGYRAFVDAINEVKPLSLPERRAISDFLESGVDLEDVMRRSAHLLAQLTRQAAVVQLPTLSVSRIKHCEVVALTPRRLLIVVITDNGRVDQRNVELSSLIDESGVTYLRDLLNGALAGKTMSDASSSLALLAADPPPAVADHVTRVIAVIMDTLVDTPSDRVLIAGAANLVPKTTDLLSVVEALEEQMVVLKLLANLPELGNVSVVIGKENEDEDLAKASIVTTSYGTAGETFGGLGVLGPTYMDYPGTIQKVAAVANYISLILAGEERT
ncbi:heat-inducible transcriptional repressor HrcA [Corynebacterium tuscaniense]|uniref:Heat-inducible transcription repressor HrcA n=1 Tax=Corynebacterium tuscaniense TaxID=302449 RepID=A0A2N6T3A2_9CORY|nr:heat-inducible transcriptional repressor HrcA [Corynebacterium tuscaniense]KAA8735994.1 heat-inducible transcriptional repressor HrcA [Corynebacterium tuscaniense]KGF21726.1 HrcA family transcriptional regulator [Corynebacterium tuscaniense DNF00037]PMC63793.1 heat-inducible transcriptional repressor HrcA [Corynebacterium tuscaniense]